MRRALGPILAIALLAACAAPRPEVVSATLGSVADGKTDATVVVRNRGAGEGQISLRVTVRDAGGRVVAREERPLEIRERETVEVTIELTVPKDASGLKLEAEAVYPPD